MIATYRKKKTTFRVRITKYIYLLLQVKQKKFEILDRNMVLSGLLNIITATHVGTQVGNRWIGKVGILVYRYIGG